MDFETALREQLETAPKTGDAKKVRAILDGPPRRRERRLRRMEAHARAQLGLGSDEDVDWSDKKVGGSIDWKKVFSALLELFVKLLPLILAA